MTSSFEYLVEALKAARKQKGLSQRDLSIKTGMPQSHLSKIEKGAVDLQASSLIEIARTLDLELMLVPRQLVPTFKSLLRGNKNNKDEQRPMYRLDGAEEEDDF
jgi:transcriptional regulator with XRE-family HTH domain